MNQLNSVKSNKILIVDDNESIHEDFKKILSAEINQDSELTDLEHELFDEDYLTKNNQDNLLNFNLDHAYQGEQAYQMVCDASQNDVPYSLIFMDVRMPPGWNGIKTISKIWSKFPDIEMIICTAYADYSHEKIVEALGKSDHLMFIKKPFDNVTVTQMALALCKKWSLNRETKNYVNNLEETQEYLIKAKEIAEKNSAAQSEFLSNMSHELRTPIHGILGFSSLGRNKAESRDNTNTSQKLKLYFDRIFNSGTRLLSLINNIIDLAKFNADNVTFNIKTNNFSEVVGKSIEGFKLLIDAKKINLKTEPVDIKVNSEFDAFKIGQVIVNFLSNALRFTPENGNINVSYKIKKEVDKKWLYFSIYNDGLNVPNAEMKEIFDPFIQSSATNDGSGGTGLGLSISQSIIKKHDGEIWVENVDSHGVQFNFKIPTLPNM